MPEAITCLFVRCVQSHVGNGTDPRTYLVKFGLGMTATELKSNVRKLAETRSSFADFT